MTEKGFNRIEILVVFVIVVSIVIIFLFFIFDLQKEIRDTRRRGDIETIAKQLEVHFNNKENEFCKNTPTGSYCLPQGFWFAGNAVPQDPLTAEPYLYLPRGGDTKFMICAKLEKGSRNTLNNQATPKTGINSGYYYCSSNQQ